ncbi:MAG TPA: TIM barrel protein [Jiangellaceae bacterium]|nr:TIM barrel protein [Jiangellaceae bacterium]
MMGVAAAPVSFGVFEMTADGPLPDPDVVLSAIRRAGYDGVDLGPVGWLGTGDALAERLRQHSLTLCGGWVDLPFSDDEAFAAALPSLDAALEVFTAGATADPARRPLPTLADSGSDVRRAHPGGAAGIGLDEAGWTRFARNLAVAAERVRAAGFEPTFHHHVGTYVETPDEIEEFVARGDVDLTLDTGHLLLGGGDPVQALRQWAGRINHVHVKDVRLSVLEDVVGTGAGMRAAWERGVFVPLGRGDFELSTFMEALLATGFGGWVVVEQDVILGPADSLDTPAADQLFNRQQLRPWLP